MGPRYSKPAFPRRGAPPVAHAEGRSARGRNPELDRKGIRSQWMEVRSAAVVVLQTWKSEGSESWIAPIMRRWESRIGPLRTEAVQQLPPWVATSPDLFESCAPFRSLELFSKPRRRIGILDWPALAV